MCAAVLCRFRIFAACTGALALALLCTPAGVAGAERPHGDVRLCTHVDPPGAPEGLAVAPDGTIYAGTDNAESNGDPKAPSKVFAYSTDCKLLRSYQITGQDLQHSHALTGMAMDAEGRLYILDIAPPRVLRLDPRTGRQEVYATLRDVPPCGTGNETQCSPGTQDFPPIPDFAAFAPDGSLYITDALQGLLWRVPKGGGAARVWFKDPRIDPDNGPPSYGPTGIALMPDGQTLIFAILNQPISCACGVTKGRIWTVPIEPGARPGKLASFWEAGQTDAPVGVAFGRSGKLYVALAGGNQIVVLSTQGHELERFPSTVDNAMLTPPMDAPAGVAFEGKRLIVSNTSIILNNPSSWALLDAFVGELGFPIVRPSIGRRGPDQGPGHSHTSAPSTGSGPAPATRARIQLSVNPARARSGQLTRFKFLAAAVLRGRLRRVNGARIRFAGQEATTSRSGRAAIITRLTRNGRYHATARKAGFRKGRATIEVERG
jgi:sugar lactone lactonase YvrE